MLLEVFSNLFMAVAEQMGERLRSTAHSVNIKERLDFSCAIFDADGSLIANAPHIPVHLGSMSESIKMVINRNKGRSKPGDVYALNDPYHGGTHLPDVTVITPVFAPPEPRARNGGRGGRRLTARLWFYVASRGHHAEIGGISPGSMPAAAPGSRRKASSSTTGSSSLAAAPGSRDDGPPERPPSSRPEPAVQPRRPAAQIAANEKGAVELRRMVAQYGLDVVHAYMGHVQGTPPRRSGNVITALSDGSLDYELDNGAHVKVKVTVDKTAEPPPSTSPARARSSPATSTRRRAWRWPPSSTSSAPWSTRTSRSMPAASSRSR